MWKTITENPRLLIFAILTSFFSGPGQTFVVSVFSQGMEDEFKISATTFGLLYSGATFLGSFSLPWLGRMMDRSELLTYSIFTSLCLALGCLALSLCQSLWMMTLGFVLIRTFGQGTMTVISATSAGKYFERAKGSAIGLASLGHPLAQGVMPVVLTAWVAQYGWRSGWTIQAAAILLVYFPLIIALLKAKKFGSQNSPDPEAKRNFQAGLLRDPRFYFAALSVVMPSGLFAALFLYQTHLAELKNWGLKETAASFLFFALGRTFTSLAGGPLVDRFGARRLLGVSYFPIILGMAALALGEDVIWSAIYLGLAGAGIGLNFNLMVSFFAEIYGTKNLGAIRGLIAFLIVIATCIFPPLLGFALDSHVSVQMIVTGIILLCIFSWISGVIGAKKSSIPPLPASPNLR